MNEKIVYRVQKIQFCEYNFSSNERTRDYLVIYTRKEYIIWYISN